MTFILCRSRRVLVDTVRSARLLQLTIHNLYWKGRRPIRIFYHVTLFTSLQLHRFCRCSQYGEDYGSVNYVLQSHWVARCVMHAQAATAELGMPTELCVLDRVTAYDCQCNLQRADASAKLGKYDTNKRVVYQNSLRIFIPALSSCLHHLCKL